MITYCIEIDRSGLPEEDVVMHHKFEKEPTREEVIKVVMDEEIGYDDDYCKLEYYPVT